MEIFNSLGLSLFRLQYNKRLQTGWFTDNRGPRAGAGMAEREPSSGLQISHRVLPGGRAGSSV